MGDGTGDRLELTWPGKGSSAAPLPEPPIPVERFGEGGNLLVHGDNLGVMAALLPEYAGAVDLVYIDPPYGMGRDFRTESRLDGRATGDGVIAGPAYSDRHLGGLAGYIAMMAPRLELIVQLLADDGFLFVQCDWRADAALRLVLDELIGAEHLRNVITWRRAPNLGRQAASHQLGRVTDTILVYSRRRGAPFPGPPPTRIEAVPTGRDGRPKGARWDAERAAWFTTAPRGDYTDGSVARLRAEGRIHDTPGGGIYVKYFLTNGPDGWSRERRIDCLWDDDAVRPLRHRPRSEHQGYETQKPEGLLERIIGWASPPDGLVADVFCGSGTTAAVAHRLGRRFLAVDAGPSAARVTRRRLLEGRAPFTSATTPSAPPSPPTKAAAERGADGSITLTGLVPDTPDSPAGRRDWIDLVESWTVAPAPTGGEPAEPLWWSVRSRNGTPVALGSPPLSIDGPALVRVVDVFGGECTIRVEAPGR